jgi:hypothetical protein
VTHPDTAAWERLCELATNGPHPGQFAEAEAFIAEAERLTNAASVWGVPVLTTVSCPGDTGVLVDTTKFGRVLVREPLGVRVGFAGDDFTRNIVRYVGEERIALAVERPEAVLEITGLPSATTRAGGKSTATK